MALVVMAGVVRAARTNSTTNAYRRLRYGKHGVRPTFLLMVSLLAALLLTIQGGEHLLPAVTTQTLIWQLQTQS